MNKTNTKLNVTIRMMLKQCWPIKTRVSVVKATLFVKFLSLNVNLKAWGILNHEYWLMFILEWFNQKMALLSSSESIHRLTLCYSSVRLAVENGHWSLWNCSRLFYWLTVLSSTARKDSMLILSSHSPILYIPLV